MTNRGPAALPAAAVCLWASGKWKVLTVSPPLGFLLLGHQNPAQDDGPLRSALVPPHSEAQDVLRVATRIWLTSRLPPPHLPVVLGADMQVS